MNSLLTDYNQPTKQQVRVFVVVVVVVVAAAAAAAAAAAVAIIFVVSFQCFVSCWFFFSLPVQIDYKLFRDVLFFR